MGSSKLSYQVYMKLKCLNQPVDSSFSVLLWYPVESVSLGKIGPGLLEDMLWGKLKGAAVTIKQMSYPLL